MNSSDTAPVMAIDDSPPHVSTIQKSLLVIFFVAMAAVGFSSIVIGSVSMGACGNAALLPVVLIVNGLVCVLPLCLLVGVNCCRCHDEDVATVYCAMEKVFLLGVAFLVASTIYALVSVVQVKNLDFLCSRNWVPPYTLAILVLQWVCFGLCSYAFCRHTLPKETPRTQFKHLKDLPPLLLSWNRHRVLRTC